MKRYATDDYLRCPAVPGRCLRHPADAAGTRRDHYLSALWPADPQKGRWTLSIGLPIPTRGFRQHRGRKVHYVLRLRGCSRQAMGNPYLRMALCRRAGKSWPAARAFRHMAKRDGAPQFSGDRPAMGWEAVAILHRQGKSAGTAAAIMPCAGAAMSNAESTRRRSL